LEEKRDDKIRILFGRK